MILTECGIKKKENSKEERNCPWPCRTDQKCFLYRYIVHSFQDTWGPHVWKKYRLLGCHMTLSPRLHASNHPVTLVKRSIALHKDGYNFPVFLQVKYEVVLILATKLNPKPREKIQHAKRKCIHICFKIQYMYQNILWAILGRVCWPFNLCGLLNIST